MRSPLIIIILICFGFLACTKEPSADITNLDCRSLKVKRIQLHQVSADNHYIDITLENSCRQCRNPISTTMSLYVLRRGSTDTLASSALWGFPLIENGQSVTYSLRTKLNQLPPTSELQIYLPLICVDIPFQP